MQQKKKNNQTRFRTDQPHWRPQVMLRSDLTVVFVLILCVRHPGHRTWAGCNWPRGSHPQTMFRALNLGSPGGLGRHFAGHAAPGPRVESAGAESPTSTSLTVSTSLSSSACGVSATHVHASTPDCVLKREQGRSKGLVGRTLGAVGDDSDRSFRRSLFSTRIKLDLARLATGSDLACDQAREAALHSKFCL